MVSTLTLNIILATQTSPSPHNAIKTRAQHHQNTFLTSTATSVPQEHELPESFVLLKAELSAIRATASSFLLLPPAASFVGRNVTDAL